VKVDLLQASAIFAILSVIGNWLSKILSKDSSISERLLALELKEKEREKDDAWRSNIDIKVENHGTEIALLKQAVQAIPDGLSRVENLLKQFLKH